MYALLKSPALSFTTSQEVDLIFQNKKKGKPKTMLVLPVLFLLRSLLLFGGVKANSSTREIMRNASMALTEPLTCDTWDCSCVFNRQRSCCCAANDLFSLEDDAFQRIAYLWGNVSTLKYSIMELSDGYKVAFTAKMDPGKSARDCFGIFSTNVPIPYADVTLNDGFGYNPTLGVFTAPCSGVYVFSATVASAVERGERLYHNVQMMKNYEVIASVWEDNREDPEDSATQSAVMPLEQGDQVYMKLMFGRKLCKHLERNVFTGYILYPTTKHTV